MGHWASNTVYLSAAHFITGIIGFLYKIILSRYLGSEGMGAYQQALAFFGTVITIITAGIPLSVSKLVAENSQNEKFKNSAIVTSAFFLTSVFALLGTAILIILSSVLKFKVLIMVLPAAIFASYSYILKGYFLGIQKALPIILSNISESIFRVLFGFFLISKNLLLHFEGKTRGAIFALTAGEFISLNILTAIVINNKLPISIKHISLKKIKSILAIAIPISLSQIINSVSHSAEALLVPKVLIYSGLSSSQALSEYGKISGMVFPLLFFPSLFIRALSSNIMPQISKALSLKKTLYAFRLSEKALFLSFFFSLAVMSFFISLAEPIARLLFPNFELSNLVIGFSACIPFFYTEQILMAIHRGTGNNQIPIITSLMRLFITNGLVIVLTSWTPLGIYSYAASLITSSAACIYFGIYKLEQNFSEKFNISQIILKPLTCSIFMIFIMKKTFLPLQSLGLPTVIFIIANLSFGLISYVAMAVALGLNLKLLKH